MSSARTTKYRVLRVLLWAGNHSLDWALRHGLGPQAFVLLETRGRRTGLARRTVVGNEVAAMAWSWAGAESVMVTSAPRSASKRAADTPVILAPATNTRAPARPAGRLSRRLSPMPGNSPYPPAAVSHSL